jgi:hypothetical protein
MRYRDLVEDGHIPGLLVHPDWWEPKHPQEIPVEVEDPIALRRPAPEISVPLGYGDPENLDGGTAPTAPSTTAVTSVAIEMNGGETHLIVNDAVAYTIGQWLIVGRGALESTHFVSRITTTANSPSFKIPFTTEFDGAPNALVGNSVYIEDGS